MRRWVMILAIIAAALAIYSMWPKPVTGPPMRDPVEVGKGDYETIQITGITEDDDTIKVHMDNGEIWTVKK